MSEYVTPLIPLFSGIQYTVVMEVVTNILVKPDASILRVPWILYYLFVPSKLHIAISSDGQTKLTSSTSWCMEFLEKFSRAGEDNLWFYGTCWFITLVAKMLQWTLSQVSSIHTFTLNLFKIHFNAILPRKPRLLKWSLHFRFSIFHDPNNLKMMQNSTAWTNHLHC